jgi:DNA sulfur modification protein DndD
MLRQLREQLLAEQRAQADEAGQTLVASAKYRFAELLKADPAFTRQSGQKLRARALTILDSAIASLAPGPDRSRMVIHALSPAATQQLLHWVDLALGDIPRSAHLFGDDLERQYRDLQRVETELKKVPADEVLKPLLEQLNTANHHMGDFSRQLSTSEDKIRAAETNAVEIQKRLDTELERLKKLTSANEHLRLVPKINSALQEFTNSLIAERVVQLEQELATCFNVLSRKTDSVRRVSISPSDFSVTLFDRSDSPLPKQALSAGEKQIYAIAVLWALARVSRRPLPLIIDTPLGRLDSDHRRLLVEGYFPSASHQVILLSTDTEVDTVYFEALKPFVAKAYRLEFDMAERCTTVESGYFEANVK